MYFHLFYEFDYWITFIFQEELKTKMDMNTLELLSNM
jgi:hypothetical protein